MAGGPATWASSTGRKYLSGGQAIHGSNDVPNYPASHGCVRVSVPAMEHIGERDLIPMDIPVWVHGEI